MKAKSETVAPTIVCGAIWRPHGQGAGSVATVSEFHDLEPANQVTGRGRWTRVVASILPSYCHLLIGLTRSSTDLDVSRGRKTSKHLAAHQASQSTRIGGPTFRG